jgi:cell division protein FtsI/penicillin-binding protein 2
VRKRRIFWLNLFSLLAMAVLLARVFQQTVLPPASISKMGRWQDTWPAKADLEHFDVLQVDDGRGRVLYRNGAPWSGQWQRVQWSGVGMRVHSEQVPPLLANPLVGVVGLPDKWPDAERAVAEQGRSGLEYTFDQTLQSRRPGFVARLRSPTHNVYNPQWFGIQAVPGADVRTSIDPAWQTVAQRALRNAHVANGAVVVLDVKTNEALAIAGVKAERVDPRVALSAQTPGSIFKLVTAAAALDAFRYRPDSQFYCSGGIHIPGVSMNCWTAHGALSLIAGIAQSCDTAFAEVGMALGRAGLETEARRLYLDETHLQSINGRPVLAEADAGAVFRHSGTDDGLLANTSIGQEDVRMTPLQAANVARTVAIGGQMSRVQVALDAEKHGKAILTFRGYDHVRAMSRHAAYWIGVGMREAVLSRSGTAHALAHHPVHAAVKTGTAELGKSPRVNGWIAGFAPYEHPDIAFAVYVGNSGSDQAHQAVRRITWNLLDAYRQFHPHSDIR